MILYYITDRMHFPGREGQRRERLLTKISEAARLGIDFIQLREKDLPAGELEILAKEAVARVRAAGSATRFLINSRTDIALAVRAHGVHLRSKDATPEDVRRVWQNVNPLEKPVVGVSCHTSEEVAAAEGFAADFALFSPIFEKRDVPQARITGLERLRSVCRGKIPVLAMGGITPENAALCVETGARGIAGIRIFQEGQLAVTLSRLRS